MENLSISEPPPQGRGMPQTPPQLPPQMFTTAAQLLDLTDKKLMVALRDGRKLIGILRSWDQFANLVLQSTTERIFAPRQDSSTSSSTHDASTEPSPAFRGYYADVSHGIFLVRGENVVLLGEIDLDKDDDPPPGYERGELDEVKKMAEEGKEREKARDKTRSTKLASMGFEGENLGEILL